MQTAFHAGIPKVFFL